MTPALEKSPRAVATPERHRPLLAAAWVMSFLFVGALPYGLRREPVVLVAAVGRVAIGAARFDEAWGTWAAKTLVARAFLGPWLMGHLGDAGLAAATATFVDAMQSGASVRARLAWQCAGVATLVGLEVAQAPLGFGTFDWGDVIVLVLAALVVVVVSEVARSRRRNMHATQE